MTPGETMTVFKQAELPLSIHELATEYQWKYPPKIERGFEILWASQSSQEFRLGQVGSISLSLPGYNIKEIPSGASLDRGRLRAIIKVSGYLHLA